MKGLSGLILAIGLGIIGAVFNFAYLTQKSRDFERVAFVGIRGDVNLAPGERLTEEVIVPVEIPAANIGNLDDFAYRYAGRGDRSLVGWTVARPIAGGSLVLRDHLATPPDRLDLGGDGAEDERAMWIPVNTRTFVPSLVNPGDQVSFLVGGGTAPSRAPSLADEYDEEAAFNAPLRSGPGASTEIVGPFEILALGNRLGSAEVFRGAQMPHAQENVMAVRVRVADDGRLEPKAQQLWDVLRATNFSDVGVLLHPR